MSAPSDLELLHGVDAEPGAGMGLRAGPVEALLVEGDLRYVCVDGIEIARRVYVGVRDPVWNTIPGERTVAEVEQGDDGFRVAFESAHRVAELAFRWRCEIRGTSDATISYVMDGVVERESSYQRIGICVLHPSDVFAGAEFEALTEDGPLRAALPAGIGPQLFEDGVFPPLVPGFSQIRMAVQPGLAATFAFDGDLFEIEDQRNWTDASFKSYSRSPPTRVEPWPLAAGTRIRQALTLTVARDRAARRPAPSGAGRGTTELRLEEADAGTVPALGVAVAAEADAPSVAAVERLRALALSHLRVDVRLDRDAWQDTLARASSLAGEIGCGLEVAAFFPSGDPSGAGELAQRLAGAAPVRRLLVFDVAATATPAELVRAVRAACAPVLPRVPIGGGTDVYFAELNRVGQLPADFEVVSYPVTPQVHADDDLSLVETPMAQADTVRQARTLAPAAAVAVTPITLRPRYNPDAPDAPTASGALPENVDRRQMSLLAAAWTLASIGRLAAAGAGSATYYETVGWRGILEEDQPAASRPPFPSLPGMVFPVYDVLRELAPLSGRPLRAAASSAPLELAGVCVTAADGEVVIVANLLARPRRARIGPLSGTRAELRRLTLGAVRAHPLQPRAEVLVPAPAAVTGGYLELALGAHEIATLRTG